ncbi:MAG: DNA methyltransferase, partial [Microcystaceae cyanobacterium]
MVNLTQTTPSNSEVEQDRLLKKIINLNHNLENNFKDKFQITPAINRKIVSYQASKDRQQYRWYKYKEAFSANLVDYLMTKYENKIQNKIIDPFAGSGTSLFACSELGYDTLGIELLP